MRGKQAKQLRKRAATDGKFDRKNKKDRGIYKELKKQYKK